MNINDKVRVVSTNGNDEFFRIGAEGVVRNFFSDNVVEVEFSSGLVSDTGDHTWYVDTFCLEIVNENR